DVAVLVIRSEVDDLVGDVAVDHLAVRRLDEAEGVDAGEGRQRADEADVRTLGGLDRAHAAVVRRVDVTDLHAGAVAGQAARAERGQAPLVGQARQRVVLVHELRELGGSEELLDRGGDRTDVDQGQRRDRLDVLRGHALADDALHAGQAGADLVLDQLAHRADATVAEVVDVVGLHAHGLAVDAGVLADAVVQRDDVLDRGDDVLEAEGGLGEGALEAELLADLVAADLREVVALGVEVEVVQHRLARIARGRLARTLLAVDVDERLVLRGDAVLLERGAHRLELAELLEDVAVRHAEGLQQGGDGLLALAVDAHADLVALVDLELEPGTARRDDLRGEDVLVARLVDGLLEVHTRGADELGDDDTLGAVDDE